MTIVLPDRYFYSLFVASAAAVASLVWQGRNGWQTWLGTVLTMYAFALLHQNRVRRIDEPPVVWSALPFLGSAISFGADTHAFLLSARAQYGDAFTVIIAGQRMTFIADPKAFGTFLKSSKELSFVPIASDVVVKSFGVKSVKDYMHYETCMGKAVHSQFIKHLQNKEELGKLIGNATGALDKALKADRILGENSSKSDWKSVPMFETSAYAVFEATVGAFFGDNFATRANYDNFRAFDEVFPLMVAGLPMPSGGKARDALKAKLQSGEPSYAEGASTFMKARKELFEQAERNDHIEGGLHSSLQTSMIWAIVANTMPTAFWSLYFIVRDPKVLQAVTDEINKVQTKSNSRDALCLPQLDELEVLESCVLESLRLTSGSIVMRQVEGKNGLNLTLPSTENSVFLRAGDRAALFPPLVHSDANVFADPQVFKLDRFVGEAGRTLARQHLMPFGGGVSLCPGRFFAVREVKAFVALALERFEWQLPDGVGPASPLPAFDPSRSGLGIYPPKEDFPVSVRLRVP